MSYRFDAARRGAVAAMGVVVLLTLTVSPLPGQTTRPAETGDGSQDPWGRLVEQFAHAAFERDDESVKAFIAKGLTLASFDGAKVRGVAEAMHEIAGGKLVSVHAYQTVPQSLASELAKDVESSTVVPDEKKSQFIPEGESAMRHANETAAEWVRRSLKIEGSTGLVGVIVVWHPKPGGDSRRSAGPVFMLLRGKTGEAHEPAFQVERIVVGSPVKQ